MQIQSEQLQNLSALIPADIQATGQTDWNGPKEFTIMCRCERMMPAIQHGDKLYLKHEPEPDLHNVAPCVVITKHHSILCTLRAGSTPDKYLFEYLNKGGLPGCPPGGYQDQEWPKDKVLHVFRVQKLERAFYGY